MMLDDNNDDGHDNYNGGDNCGDDCVKPKLSAFVSLCAGYLPMSGYSSGNYILFNCWLISSSSIILCAGYLPMPSYS